MRNYMKNSNDTLTIDAESIKSGMLIQRLEIDFSEETKEFLLKALQPEPKTKYVAQIEVDTEEVVKRIKEEYDITDGWVPCSKRLPSDDESVIVSVLDDRGDTPWKYTTVAWRYNGVWISDNDILCGTAVAWMPLPKPYREESEVKP